jgi:uncharacterized protein YceH (UPF0502 family)
MQEVFNFDRREIAVVCVLLLRGPQTPGELRGRGERMYRFETLDDVQSTLQRLIDRDLVRVLPRQPGTKESRYMHLFAGDVAPDFAPAPHVESGQSVASSGNHGETRVAALESEVASLRREIAELRRELGEFKQQF